MHKQGSTATNCILTGKGQGIHVWVQRSAKSTLRSQELRMTRTEAVFHLQRPMKGGNFTRKVKDWLVGLFLFVMAMAIGLFALIAFSRVFAPIHWVLNGAA